MSKQILTSKIAEPYATALLNLAISTHTLDLVSEDMNDLLEIFSNSPELENYLASPLYSKESKKDLLKNVLVPFYFNQNSLKFLMTLIERGRISLVPTIAGLFFQKVFEYVNVQCVNVTSAFALNSSQEQELKSLLSQAFNSGEVRLETKIDKTLLGGFQIQFGSYIIDASLKAQLQKLAAQLDVSLF